MSQNILTKNYISISKEIKTKCREERKGKYGSISKSILLQKHLMYSQLKYLLIT